MTNTNDGSSLLNPNHLNQLQENLETSLLNHLGYQTARSYIAQVQFEFETQPEVFPSFVRLMIEIRSKTIDTKEFMLRILDLFKGHADLIECINEFLPPGYEFKVESNDFIHCIFPDSSEIAAIHIKTEPIELEPPILIPLLINTEFQNVYPFDYNELSMKIFQTPNSTRMIRPQMENVQTHLFSTRPTFFYIIPAPKHIPNQSFSLASFLKSMTL